MTARILVVDDIEANRNLLETRLTAEYFNITTAENGHDALAICAESPVDLVLLATKRARQLANGVEPTLAWENDKPTVMALREIAEVRMRYPEASLQELGDCLQPPLTKSAVYHRLLRIRRIASSIG
jgi:DNA-directed RNA polymerase omega subunit